MIRTSTLLIAMLTFCAQANSQPYNEAAQSLGINHTHVDFNQIGGGIAVFDLNGDGYEDLYLTGGSQPDKLYLNNTDGTFTDISNSSGIGSANGYQTVGVTTGDLDNDGDRDIFVTTFVTDRNILFRNNGDNTFTDISASAGITDSTWSTSVTMGDYNKDGFLDIYISNYAEYTSHPFFLSITNGVKNTLYLNNGAMSFTDVTDLTGTGDMGTSLAAAFTDFDRDTDVDLMVGNDFGYNYEPNALFQNNYPTSNFTNVASSTFTDNEIDAMGIAIGDIDEDGDFDYYISNMMDNLLHIRNPGMTFSESALPAMVQIDTLVSWGTFFFDYDNDTYLDLFVANGGVMMVSQPQQNVLFENQQNGTFQDIAISNGIDSIKRSRGAVYADFNNDGALDIVVAQVGQNISTSFETSVYMNANTSNNHWIAFNLSAWSSNADAYGAQIELHNDGRIWIREVGGGSSYLSQNSSRIHFGLGSYTSYDSVVVIFPDGVRQVYTGLLIDQIHSITQNVLAQNAVDLESMLKVYPNPAKSKMTILNSSGTKIETVKIIDQLGRIIQNIEVDLQKLIKLDVSSISTGLYSLQINTENDVIVKMIEVIR